MSSRPWQHQIDALNFCIEKRAALLGMAMGTGKSRVVCDLIKYRNHRKVLILCPKSVVRAWPKQFARWYPHVLCHALDEGSVASRHRESTAALGACAAVNGTCILIINYDAARMEPFASWALKQEWDLVVCDESHRIKSPTSVTRRWVCGLTRRSAYRLALSGTPMAQSPLDVWGQFCFLNPDVFGRSAAFKQRYGRWGGFQQKQLVGLQNEEELNEKFYSIAFRVTSDVLDLPPVLHERRTFSLSAKAAALYKSLKDELICEIDAGEVTAANALVRLLRLQQLTGGYLKADNGTEECVDDGKYELLKDTLSDLPADEPVVVFCRFRADIRNVRVASDLIRRSNGELSGSASDLESFQKGQISTLAVQIGAGSEGIDLTRARYCFFYSLGFSLPQYQQALARVHRPGQTRPVVYYHLVAETPDGKETVDGMVYKALERREDAISAVLKEMR